MAKGKDEKIPDIKTSWDGYSGNRVEEFIKESIGGKVGYLHRTQEKGSDNNYHLYGFASEADFNEWNSDPDSNSHLLLTDVALPESGGGSTATSYIVGLYTDSPGTIVTLDNTVKLNIRFTSEEYNPITQATEPTTEGCAVTVQTRLNAQSSWTTRGTIENIPSFPAVSTNEWWAIDITDMLNSGTQQVRLIAKGDTTGLNTRYLQFTVTKTSLGLTFATQWERPVTDGVMRLSYYVSGAVSKTLHIKIDGQRTIERNLGTAVNTETPVQIEVTDTDSDAVKVITHGVHDIEAWISVNNSEVESEHKFSQLIVLTDSSDLTPLLILNDLKKNLTNGTTEQILAYAVYNPAGEDIPLKFSLESYNGDKHYMVLDVGYISSGVRYTLSNMIEIDSEETTIDAYMRFYSGEDEIHSVVGFEVDNSENFTATSNPDFILNPRLRTNSELFPDSIVNAATGDTVTSRWAGFGFVSDGWVEDSDGRKCLRVLAGKSLEIDYEAFSGYIGSDNRSSVTVEFDLATRNAVDTESPVLRMCSYDSEGEPLGFELCPWQAAFLTQNKRQRDDQDIMFSEGVRTHIALNIIYGINGTAQNYVRLFVNGTINREFLWDTDDVFVRTVGGVATSQGIRIGSEGCDIDIYGIRVYKRALSATDIRQDYIASLPQAAEKRTCREANDILDDSNLISYAKTREKYSTIVITGKIPSYVTGNIKTDCQWDIHIIGDPEHSGTLNNVVTSGQGTSSRSYWKWNLQGKVGDDTVFIDENGLAHPAGEGYQLDDSVPFATKLVAKLNWASSQQSHKLGSCNLFTDLWRRCTGGSSITNTEGFENCRVSVKQKPVFLFTRPTLDAEPVFYGLYTFGPGKGDKPTFGYDKKKFPNYLMIEGCDNGEPLTNHRIPWNDDVTIGGDEGELILYNGRKQWEIDMGNSGSLSYFVYAFNFIYLCNPHIAPFVGTVAQLQAATENEANRQTLYWVTQATGTTSSRYDLYRYDELTSQWVDAGVAKRGTGSYARLNLSTQLGITPSSNIWEEINEQFIQARIQRFKDGASAYFKMDDAFFHQMFCKLIGASDNRAKNTYMYLATHEGDLKIHFAQDDLDTIFLTDNVGRKNKPYYVEEHDRNASGGTYWNGEKNALYDLMEMAFDSEMRAMMKTILTEMASLASDNTLMGCMDDYYFSIQKYFPAVAYNEAARLLYEEASAKWATGEYVASTHPITQSLGDQLQGEMQWVKLRLVYLSSFASYGDFTMNGKGSLTWRSATTTAGTPPSYTFKLTPHIWLYPSVSAGSSTMYGEGYSHPQRVKAGETFILDGVNADNDTNIQLHGINYYTDIGNFGDKSLLGTSFTVAGERLKEFHAFGEDIQFRPSSVVVTAPNLRVFDINGASTVKGSVNLSTCVRMEEIDLRGTAVSSFQVADPKVVKQLHLPASLTELVLRDYASLTNESFSIEGGSKISKLVISNCPNLSSLAIVTSVYSTANKNLSQCVIYNVDWADVSLDILEYLADIKADITGHIQLPRTAIVNFGLKRKFIEAWGNVDDGNNALVIEYTKRSLTDINIKGCHYISEVTPKDNPEKYKYDVVPTIPNANNFSRITWSIAANNFAAIDESTGVLNVVNIGEENLAPKAKVTVEIELSEGGSIKKEIVIGFYNRSCHLGDYVFADGTFSDMLEYGKTPVGVCFYINSEDKTQRLCVALSDFTNWTWGLRKGNNDTSFTEIALQDTPGYSVFDITSLKNLNVPGLSSNVITAETYRDETSAGDADGFKILKADTAFSEIGFETLVANLGQYPEGTKLPYGHIKTLRIIAHRNTILTDSAVNLQLPQQVGTTSPYQNLLQLMREVVADNGSLEKYCQFYYPAASLCNCYEPEVMKGETLSEKFKTGKWFLPSAGELARIYWYSHQGKVSGATDAIFVKAIGEGIMMAMDGGWYHSSTECSPDNDWGVEFGGGMIQFAGKDGFCRVRPIAAF